MKPKRTLVALVVLSTSFFACVDATRELPENSLFRIEYSIHGNFSGKGDTTASGFILKIVDFAPIFLTVHHAFAERKDSLVLRPNWDEIDTVVKDPIIWCVQDTTVRFSLGSNIQLEGAKTLGLDAAAFRIPNAGTLGIFEPSPFVPSLGDTVYLYAKLHNDSHSQLLHMAEVVGLSDTMLTFHPYDTTLTFENFSHTSGSPILGSDFKVVANMVYGGPLTEEDIAEWRKSTPSMRDRIIPGKLIGGGVRIELITQAVVNSLSRSLKNGGS